MADEIISSALRRLCERPGQQLLPASEVIEKLSATELLSKKGGDTLLHAETRIGNDDNCWALLDRAEKTACLTDMLASRDEDERTALQIACDKGYSIIVRVLLDA